MRTLWRFLLTMALLLTGAVGVLAQEAQESSVSLLPSAHRLNGLSYEPQLWNNCGPATLTNALSFFGYTADQTRAAAYLKPNDEDKNVSPDQMISFVNNQVPEIPVYALVRYGGTRDQIKELLVNQFPVIIEKGYDPEPDRLGWMGHYLLMTGYDDAQSQWITSDSYIGDTVTYSYDYIDRMWQHFNYTYIVLYREERRAELDAILGSDADPRQNITNALVRAQQEANADQSDRWAWFNMGSNFVMLGMHDEAAAAYDIAINLQMPWRVTWYQFGPFEAYYHTGQYDRVIELARKNLNDGGGQYVEETFYYGGLAREAMGEMDRALGNYREAVRFNPNFTPAVEALNRLQSNGG